MLYIKNLEDGIPVFKALSSKTRVDIVNLLLKNHEMNMTDLANALKITNGALTSHIKDLQNAGIVSVYSGKEGHGNQKTCRMDLDKILVDVAQDPEGGRHVYSADIPIGQYVDYKAFPTCGLSTAKELVGPVDEPRVFAYPDRTQAQILWFTKGYVEYIIPNLLPADAYVSRIYLSFEISSEAPGINNDWPSDITFSFNETKVGTWTSPGDYGDVRGLFTPDWWFDNWNQYGLLKVLEINRDGTFIDGLKISDVSITQFDLNDHSQMRFRFEVPEDAIHVGGLTLFGRQFGNYSQDINVRVRYHMKDV